MATYEHNGVFTYKDEQKNVHLMYPVTRKDNVEGMEVVDQEISDLRAFVGYTDSDIYGVEVDLKNKKFTRLAGAVGLTAGANFDKIKAFGGRRRCILSDDGVVLAYAGEAGYTESGALIQAVTVNGTTFPIGTKAQVMVEQPQFFYIGLIGGLISSLFGGWDAALVTLIIFMGIDYVTGLIVAGVFRNSEKTTNGGLESRAGWKGLCRKGVTLLVVLVGCRLDLIMGSNFIRDAVVIAFTANETISIIENAGLMGIPIPAAILRAIDILKNKAESEGE